MNTNDLDIKTVYVSMDYRLYIFFAFTGLRGDLLMQKIAVGKLTLLISHLSTILHRIILKPSLFFLINRMQITINFHFSIVIATI